MYRTHVYVYVYIYIYLYKDHDDQEDDYDEDDDDTYDDLLRVAATCKLFVVLLVHWISCFGTDDDVR